MVSKGSTNILKTIKRIYKTLFLRISRGHTTIDHALWYKIHTIMAKDVIFIVIISLRQWNLIDPEIVSKSSTYILKTI